MTSKKSTQVSKMSRRYFFGYAAATPALGMSAPPFMALFASILNGQAQKAYADVLGIKTKSLVTIHHAAAPPTYMADLFLTPYSTDNFNTENPMVGTQFKRPPGATRYDAGVEYATHSVKGIQAPTMWTHNLPTPGNGWRPMADLLDNLLCIQGITTKNAGHGASTQWLWEPPGAKRSLPALSADLSNAPLAALNVGASGYQFTSLNNKSALRVNQSGNLISNILTPFQSVATSTFQDRRRGVSEAYTGLLPVLDEMAKNGNLGAAAVIQNRNSAFQLAETNFAGLTAEWTNLVNKYNDLIKRATFDSRNNLSGINDLPIGHGGAGPTALYQMGTNLDLSTSPDLRDSITETTGIGSLAQNFALTEYVLLKNLSSSISMSLSSTGGLRLPSGGIFALGNDQHSTGLYPQFYFTFMRHRAVSACILELISQLKSVNKFNDTVIINTGEFIRNPRMDMTGSDHGFNGTSRVMYSGSFNGPLIVGNLRSEGGTNGRRCWGAGGKVPELGRQLNLIDTLVTIAHLVGIDPPFTSTSPIVTLTSNGLVSHIGTTRHVAA